MKYQNIILLLSCFFLILSPALAESNSTGQFKVGLVLVEEEGSLAANQPTYNTYEGASISLEKFQHIYPNSVRLYANLKNITLNNRNLSLGLTKSGSFGFTLRNNQYSRTYDFDGSIFTRRNNTSANLWIQPSKYIRLFGGVGRINKHGNQTELFDLQTMLPVYAVDYSQASYNGGIKLMYGNHYLKAEYRSSQFEDNLNLINNRITKRYRFSGLAQIKQLNNLIVYGGFQRHETEVEFRLDTLFANTVWGGLKGFYGDGFTLQYYTFWDRSRRTGDLVATDNISHTVNLGKVWSSKGGLTVGYRYAINDDLFDELQTNGYIISGWIKPVDQLTVRARYGSDEREVEKGSTLTGKREITNHSASAKYKLPEQYGFIRARAQMKKTENDDIGSSAEFIKSGVDGYLIYSKYAELEFDYSYVEGDYINRGEQFIFSDHVINGDILSSDYKNTKIGFGGTYVRSRQHVDIESSQLRFLLKYSFMGNHLFEAKYSVHNFDNLASLTSIYTEYYTANIVEVTLTYEF